MEDSAMPSYQQITSAREKAKRIRECAGLFRRERVRLEESTRDIRRAVSAASASQFISEVL
jgi:hypothetical protein